MFGTQTENAPFAYASSTEGGLTATFQGKLERADEAVEWAYYPYDKQVEVTDHALTLTLPTEYTYDGRLNAPMVALKPNTEDNTLEFKHLCGLLCITVNNLPADAERFTITSAGETAPGLAGPATVSDVTADDPTLVLATNKQKTITYRLGSLNADGSGFKTFFVPVPTGEYPRIEISLYTKNNAEPAFTRTLEQQTISRATMLQVPILDGTTGEGYVLGENTTPITTDLFDLVSTVPDDATSLVYSADATNILPTVGRIIWTPVSEAFPNGFLGKVSSVEQQSDGSYLVKTEVAPLSEAFDLLYINETVDLEMEDGGGTPVKTRIGTAPERTYSFDATWLDGINVNGTVQLGAQLLANIEIDREHNKDFAMLTAQSHVGISATFKIACALNGDEKVDGIPMLARALKVKGVRLGNGIVQIEPSLMPYIHCAPKGEMNFTMEYTYDQSFYAGAQLKDGVWEAGATRVVDNDKSPWDFSDQFKFQGELFVGVSARMNGELYGRDDATFFIEPKFGYKVEGELDLDLGNPDLSMKDILSTLKLTGASVLSGDIGIDASLFVPGDLELSMTVAEKELGKFEWYVLPQINKVNLVSETSSSGTSIIAQTNATRETLTKGTQIAIDVRNSEGNTVQTSEDVSYRGENDENGKAPSPSIRRLKTFPKGRPTPWCPSLSRPCWKRFRS